MMRWSTLSLEVSGVRGLSGFSTAGGLATGAAESDTCCAAQAEAEATMHVAASKVRSRAARLYGQNFMQIPLVEPDLCSRDARNTFRCYRVTKGSRYFGGRTCKRPVDARWAIAPARIAGRER